MPAVCFSRLRLSAVLLAGPMLFGQAVRPNYKDEVPPMARLSSAELAEVLDQGEGYRPALAVHEARRRQDFGLDNAVRAQLDRLALKPSEAIFDPHQISPRFALFVASTEYLAAVERLAFLPKLLGMRQVWQAPSMFIATFRAVGRGWVQPVIERIQSLPASRRPAALMDLVGGGATADNLDELIAVLHTGSSDVWLSAAQACARLDTPDCLKEIRVEGRRQSPREQLRVATLVYENRPESPDELFSAAARAAAALIKASEPETKADLAVELGGFLRFLRVAGLQPPTWLADQIRLTRVAPLIRELPAL